MRGDIEWGKYFSKKEFQCSTTGDCKMEQDFIDKMNQLREMFGKPIVITSGYRSALKKIQQSNPLRRIVQISDFRSNGFEGSGNWHY